MTSFGGIERGKEYEAYLTALSGDEGKGDLEGKIQKLQKNAKKSFQKDHGDLDLQKFGRSWKDIRSKSEGFGGRVLRKVAAVPQALFALGKVFYHTGTLMFAGKGQVQAAKVQKARIRRDFQEAGGRIATIFHDTWGQYYVQKALFEKACYAEGYRGKRADEWLATPVGNLPKGDKELRELVSFLNELEALDVQGQDEESEGIDEDILESSTSSLKAILREKSKIKGGEEISWTGVDPSVIPVLFRFGSTVPAFPDIETLKGLKTSNKEVFDALLREANLNRTLLASKQIRKMYDQKILSTAEIKTHLGARRNAISTKGMSQAEIEDLWMVFDKKEQLYLWYGDYLVEDMRGVSSAVSGHAHLVFNSQVNYVSKERIKEMTKEGNLPRSFIPRLSEKKQIQAIDVEYLKKMSDEELQLLLLRPIGRGTLFLDYQNYFHLSDNQRSAIQNRLPMTLQRFLEMHSVEKYNENDQTTYRSSEPYYKW